MLDGVDKNQFRYIRINKNRIPGCVMDTLKACCEILLGKD